MRFEGAYTEAEYLQFMNLDPIAGEKDSHSLSSITRPIFWLGVIGATASLALWVYLFAARTFHFASYVGGASIVFCLSAFLLHSMITHRAHRQSWQHYAAVGHYLTGSVTDDILEISCKACSVISKFTWEAFVGYAEYSDGIVLFTVKHEPIPLSRSFFGDEHDWLAFRDRIARILPRSHAVRRNTTKTERQLISLGLWLMALVMLYVYIASTW